VKLGTANSVCGISNSTNTSDLEWPGRSLLHSKTCLAHYLRKYSMY